MTRIKTFLLSFILVFSLTQNTNSQSIPGSFADLAERLMPSVVNISTTTTITTRSNPFPFQFPPGSPFEDMFKDFGTPQERQAYALGSGFIIDEKGIVITNNHVIKDADDILVRVNGDKEYEEFARKQVKRVIPEDIKHAFLNGSLFTLDAASFDFLRAQTSRKTSMMHSNG